MTGVSAGARVLRLSPEFGCWPLWDDATGENLAPDQWLLSEDLTVRLTAWDDIFQATLDSAYPPDSRFGSPAEEADWRAEGQALAVALAETPGVGRVLVRI